MTEIEPAKASAVERSNLRKAELASKLTRIEERVLGLVETGLTSARNTFSVLSASDNISPQALVQTSTAVEKLYKVAKDICGEPEASGPGTVINVNNMPVDAGLVAAVAEAYASVQMGNLDRAEALIAQVDDEIDILDADVVPDQGLEPHATGGNTG